MKKNWKNKLFVALSIFGIVGTSLFSFSPYSISKLTNSSAQSFASNQSFQPIRQADDSTVINIDDQLRVSTIITPNGPLVYKENVFSLLDWFGKPIWSFDLKKQMIDKKYFPTNVDGDRWWGFFPKNYIWASAIFNSVDKKFYILSLATQEGFGDPTNQMFQYVIPVNITTGEIDLASNPPNQPRIDVRKSTSGAGGISSQLSRISILGNGNMLLYNLLGTSGIGSGGALAAVYNIQNKKVTIKNLFGINGSPYSPYNRINRLYSFFAYLINIIPISNDYNLAVFMQARPNQFNFPYAHSQGISSLATAVVDNNVNLIDGQMTYDKPDSISYLLSKSNKKVWDDLNGVSRTLSISNFFGYNINYYINPLTRETQFVLYNKMFFIKYDPTKPNKYSFRTLELPTVQSSEISSEFSKGIMYGGYFDLLGDFFFNMATWNSEHNNWNVYPTIYRMSNNGSGNNLPQISAFTNLNTSNNPDIKRSINRFKIIPISGQVGKIMLINLDTGITVAIASSLTNRNIGRILGTLNGKYALTTGNDFRLKPSANFLVPSQINLNNFDVGVNSQLSEVKVESINDLKGSLEATGIINYLPWFEDSNSTNSQTIEVKRKFTNLQTSSDASAWISQLPIQFQKVFPSQIQASDLAKINPFQTYINSLNNLINGKNLYSITSANDTTGSIVVKFNATYAPNLDSNATKQAFQDNHTYNLLSSTTLGEKKYAKFSLLGGSNFTNQKINTISTKKISEISSLAKFQYNNSLPSLVAANIANAINFVDWDQTLGFPLWKLIPQMKADDSNGTLKISYTIPIEVLKKLNIFQDKPVVITTTYSGFVTSEDVDINLNKFASVNYISDKFALNLSNLLDDSTKKELSTYLPSQINVNKVLSDFINGIGYNLNQALDLELIPNDQMGVLDIKINPNPQYQTNISKTKLFANANNQTIDLQVNGFVKSYTDKDSDNLITVVSDQNLSLIKLTKKAPSTISKMDALNLLNTGKNIKNAGITLSEKEITLRPNDYSGELGIVVDISGLVKDSTKPLKTNFPTLYSFTFTNFLQSIDSSEYIFQTISNDQIDRSSMNLAKLTREQVFSKQNLFLRQMKGYKLQNANQIKVIHNLFLKSVTINFTFNPNSSQPVNLTNFFTTTYTYSSN